MTGFLVGGGAEVVCRRLAGAWAAGGHDVHVVALHERDAGHASLPSGVVLHALGLGGSPGGLLGAVRANARSIRTLRRALLAIAPDVVVSFLTETNVLSLAATRLTGLPVVVAERTDPRRHVLRTPWGALRRLLYPRAAALVVQTGRVAAWGRVVCAPGRVHVIPNAVPAPSDTPAPPPDWLPDGPYVAAVGRLGAEKGFDLLLRAFATFARARPGWSLVICGEGPERARLESLRSREGLAGRVLLPGHVASPDAVVTRARLFVLPSRYEGFPNALLEAMRDGVPVVAFDCDSGPAEIVTDGVDGVLVPAGDVEGLARAMARVADDGPLAARLASAARAVRERFAPDRILAQWEVVLRDTARVAPQPRRP